MTAGMVIGTMIGPVIRKGCEMARGYWTFEQVQEYLGHTNPGSTEVWLSRHGIRAERLYRIKDVKSEREVPVRLVSSRSRFDK